jgi:nicotinate-nucleotide--dimethylbenzimidazole phosphoribosyltransferase
VSGGPDIVPHGLPHARTRFRRNKLTGVEWQRPVPVIGDATAASQRAADPAGWAFPDIARAALYDIVAARRDVRRFRPDGVPDEVLRRILAAAHSAPSVGHSQPWRFVVVRDPAHRERAGLLADRERLRQAAQMEPDAARRLLDLQLEGIREAPIGIVVGCDRRTDAAGVLGRATFPDADVWSCAAAIENLWLAARAEGLGVGWVTLFRPADLAALVGLPDGVVSLGWLCVGWPDERPPAPGLQRAGWSTRIPLDDVIFPDRWRDATAAPRSHLRAPDPAAVVGARDAADRLLTPPGSLGALDRAVDRVVALGRGDITTGTLVLAAADHPVTAHGVSAYPGRVTREVLTAAAAGKALGVRAAVASGLGVRLIDAGVSGRTGARDQPDAADAVVGVGAGAVDITRAPLIAHAGDLRDTDALGRDDTTRLIAFGRDLGRSLAGLGLVALGEIGVGNTTVSACLAVAMLGLDVTAAVGLGSGADAAMLDRKRDTVTAAVARWRKADGGDDPIGVLAALGGPELAVLAGVTLGAAEGGTAIVLDGLATSLAALVAVRLEPAVAAHLVAGQRSRERAHAAVLTELGLEPLLDLRIRSGEGVGAGLGAGLLLTALELRRSTARVTY